MKDSEKYNYDDNESTVDLINYDRIERDQFSDDFFSKSYLSTRHDLLHKLIIVWRLWYSVADLQSRSQLFLKT